MKASLRYSVPCGCLALALTAVPSFAQSASSTADTENADDTAVSDTDAILNEIVVTGTKRAGGINAQEAPVAVSAFGEEQIKAMQIKDITQFALKTPSVAMDDIGTAKGTANFTIRGLGVNSSIPSIDPAVGVFVDGVYLGMNAGVVMDAFDISSVEVLRGPQGVLFGRNVTGGAVLLNSTDPTSTPHYDFTGSITSGLRGTGMGFTVSGVARGPLVGDVLSAKVAAYYNNEEGWFENLATGSDFGKSETSILRGALKFTPSGPFTAMVKYEHGDSKGDGPAGQSHTNGFGVPGAWGNYSRDSFDFAVDETGYFDTDWDQVTGQIDIEVGRGTITNIAGYRRYQQFQLSDIDASPLDLFHANIDIKQRQFSNELRYNGRIGDRFDLTTGVFYFTQDLKYAEHRRLLGGALHQYGGGVQDQETIGIFANGDFDITDALTLSAGLRWSHESKDDKIASLNKNVNSECNVVEGTCAFDFAGDISQSNWSPRLGIQYEISPTVRSYANYSRAYRAGGFNFRNTASDTVNFGPGPFDDEKVDAWELGFKTEPFDRARFNVAGYYMTIADMQREVNLTDPVSGVVQVIKNTADARIWGLEADFVIPLGAGIVVDGAVGYVNGAYQKVFFDLNGDGVLNAADKDLDIPRLAPWNGNIGLTVEQDLPVLGSTTARVSYAYRDASPFTDNNRGQLNELNRIDASLAIKLLDDRGTFTLFGQNLTNNVQIGSDTQLPSMLGPVPLGGTFSPLSRGRIFGIELRLRD